MNTPNAFLDWGGGLAWLEAPNKNPQAEKLRALTARSGGHATLLRAGAELRARLDVFQPQPAALAALTGRVKDSFDPLRILNPGRMYAGI
jgi:glycolate oxidase FAD binding subunit